MFSVKWAFMPMLILTACGSSSDGAGGSAKARYDAYVARGDIRLYTEAATTLQVAGDVRPTCQLVERARLQGYTWVGPGEVQPGSNPAVYARYFYRSEDAARVSVDVLRQPANAVAPVGFAPSACLNEVG